MAKKILLTEKGLTINDIWNIVKNNHQVILTDPIREKITLARKAIEKAVKTGTKIYGITTGFGALRDIVIPEKDATKLQTNLIRSHCVGVGEATPDEVVKAMMILRVTALTRGFSGCKLETIEQLIEMVNKNALPIIPIKGSVGASGDLAPLSHMALTMIGEGENNLKFKNKIYDAVEGLKKAKINPIKLSYKEGLALNNGAQFSTGFSVLNIKRAEVILKIAIAAATLSMEALLAAKQQFDLRIQEARNHPGQIEVAMEINRLLEGSKFVKIHQGYYRCQNKNCGYYFDKELEGEASFEELPEGWLCPNCGANKKSFKKMTKKIQDDYCIRCTPQVLGPIHETIAFCKQIVQREINAATDNPLILLKEKEPLTFDIYSGGNFHGEPIALAMDYLSIALAEIGSISERRSAKLIDKNRNDGLGAFLVDPQSVGLNSGYMMPQYTAAALTSENKVLASPASVDSIPTSADAEDHVSMSPIAARKTRKILGNLQDIISIEMMLAIQGIDIRCEIQQITPKKALGEKTYKLYSYLRKLVPKLTEDRIIEPDIKLISEKITSGEILQVLK
ncbi:MAG: aromatic amino acid lyase [Asgard group archaeon]|nr:aromatic amino acid lyase [Asgard group archaeon]